jgi:titin
MWRRAIRRFLNSPRAERRPNCARPQLMQLEGRDVPAVFTVTNTLDAGDGSLRWALEQANTAPGHDTIEFNIPGAGVHTIAPASALPALTDSGGVTIDGYTQPGAAPNTLVVGDSARLLIELDGSSAGTEVDGLQLAAGSNTVRGLVINGFDRYGVFATTSDGNVITGNFIGTDPTGTLDRSTMSAGVFVASDAPNTRIGSTDPADRNVLSGNGDPGTRGGAGATLRSRGNVVAGNYIGTDASGVRALANVGDVNFGAINNFQEGNTIQNNVIAGNTGGVGILMYNSTFGSASPLPTLIRGNTIGLGADGMTPLGNLYGIYLALDSRDVTIGGTNATDRNVISENGFGVILDVGAADTTIQGDYIGTDATGTLALGNTYGLFDYGTLGLRVGGPTAEPGTGAGNVISGNSGTGIILSNNATRTSDPLVQGNLIGLGAGEVVIGGQIDGVVTGNSLHDDPGRLISATIGGSARGAGNVISGNVNDSILLGHDTVGTVVAGNRIGTDGAGTIAEPNGNGIRVQAGATGNTIGGTVRAARNVISGNRAVGVELEAGAENNTVLGNFIGTDATGGRALGNGAAGVEILGPNNLIGGSTSGARNVISGNDVGVFITGGAAISNAVFGDYIGTNAMGTAAVANRVGVRLDAGAYLNAVGYVGEGNVISGNILDGIQFEGTRTGANALVANAIGTDVRGRALGNGRDGVFVGDRAESQLLGGNTDFGNTIRGNGRNGVTISGPDTAHNVVSGNLILDNGRSGVALLDGAGENTVGGSADDQRNVISGNADAGVEVASTINTTPFVPSAHNVIEGNWIGTTTTGLRADPNGIGVVIAGGQQTAVHGNIISGNTNAGIDIVEPTSTGNLIQANWIGVSARDRALGNGLQGVYISVNASNNEIGGGRFDSDPALGNEIAYNGGAGVVVGDTGAGLGLRSVGNTIRFNSIHDNGGLGIDLGNNGPTPFTLPPADAGPNNWQSAPLLLPPIRAGGITTISGIVFGRPGETLLVDLYSSPAPDPSGFGEGQVYLGTVEVPMPSTGVGTFTFETSAVSIGSWVTATATRKDTGDTSEFSNWTGPIIRFAIPSDPDIRAATKILDGVREFRVIDEVAHSSHGRGEK